MTKGENISPKFVEYFKDFEEGYVIIGGTALSIVTAEMGLKTRVTKDYDMVLTDTDNTTEFIKTLNTFIEDAQYNKFEKDSESNHNLYRFTKPRSKEFPYMLEFFARKQDGVTLKIENGKTPLHFEDTHSLSALLLNDEYFELLERGSEKRGGLIHLSFPYLIVFKAKAWLDLSERKARGESNVKSTDIKKHINDIFTLAQGIIEGEVVELNAEVEKDMREFIEKVRDDESDYALNISSALSKGETLGLIEKLFSL